jgi:hypothetical protein
MEKEKRPTILETIVKGPTSGFIDNFPKREMWKEIAKELNGEFLIKLNAGNYIEMHRISIPHKKWKIEISVSDSRPLKFNISFAASQDFRLIVSWEDFFDRLFKLFGKREIDMGWKEFDKHYLVISNRSDLARQIITRDIQKALLKYNIYSVSYQTNAEKRTAELVSVIQRYAGDKEMILELIELFRLLTDNLEKYRVIT